MLRNVYLITFIYLFGLTTGLSAFSTNPTSFPKDTIKCDSLSIPFANILNTLILQSKWQESYQLIEQWKETCDATEINSRAAILVALSAGVRQEEAIKSYFQSDFHFVYKYRMQYSEDDLYQYYFQEYRTYFNYIPLRHPLDSTLCNIAKKIFSRTDLSDDEKLACKLFSGDFKSFEKESKKKKYINSYVRNFHNADKRYLASQKMGFQLFSGIYNSMDEGQYIGANPSLGIGLNSPIAAQWMFEFQIRCRIMQGDKKYNFVALGDNYLVDSKLGINLNINVMYQYSDIKNIFLYPKFGLGYEAIFTGVKIYNPIDEVTNSYDINTLHSNIGILILTPCFRKNYIGLEASYHYCPYRWSKGLKSKFNNNAFSLELIYRF
jgi:hypothetical protein